MQRDIVARDIKRVLIIAFGSLGDIILSIAAIEAIHKYHKNAHIVLFTEAFARRLFDNCPYIDEIVTNHRPNGMKEDLSLGTGLQKARIDMVYDLTGNEETEALYKKFWLSKPKWSGVAAGCSHPHIDRARGKLHPLDRLAEQLWLCGIGPEEGYPLGASPLPNMEYLFTQEESEKYHPRAFGIDYNFALLIPEAPFNEPQSAWPSFRYIDLGHALLKMGLKPIIVGTHNAIALGNEIRAGVPEALDLVGRLDLKSFISLAKYAKLVIGSNSDLSVIAGVVGAPLVALINPQNSHLKQIAPRGYNSVTLVSRDFTQIDSNQILQAGRAVMQFEAV